MLFVSPTFLFAFLPLTLLLYALSPQKLKNTILLLASLLFYAWGEPVYLLLMLASIALNWIFGELIAKYPTKKKRYLLVGISLNLAGLIFFKYSNFLWDNTASLLHALGIEVGALRPIHLPIGISFFTFQALSYIVDVYRGETEVQKNPFKLGLYISLFPQLIAGPIVRYVTIAKAIDERRTTLAAFGSGSRRFVYGLAKKMLLANPIGELADNIFALPAADLSMPLAWLGILAYSLQIYMDFSAYSDMAIGLGRMLGFEFLENFNYPYISQSIREFWRRWHISLSTWFRDYVYIPLGGSRASPRRVSFNLITVFVLTGFWHGAAWNFLVWGLFHGLFIVLERQGLADRLLRLPRPFRHIYTLLIAMIAWVFFRAPDLDSALHFIQAMFDPRHLVVSRSFWMQMVRNEALFAIPVAIVLSMPVFPWLIAKYKAAPGGVKTLLLIPETLLLTSILVMALAKSAASTYNPFIYFRF